MDRIERLAEKLDHLLNGPVISRRGAFKLTGIAGLDLALKACSSSNGGSSAPTRNVDTVSVIPSAEPIVDPTATSITTESATTEPTITAGPPTTPTVTESTTTAPVEGISIDPEIRQIAKEAFQKGYEEWKSAWVRNEGLGDADELRAIWDKDKRNSNSEVVAYSMIYAVNAEDKPTFDSLWKYAKSHLNSDGLMSNEINADNTPADDSSAADADLDIAYGLIIADNIWGGYRDDATRMIENILKHDVEPGSYVLKGGNDWGGFYETNPSYYSPAYYQLFKEYTGNTDWDRVTEAGRQVFAAIKAKRQTLLPPDWTTADGSMVPQRGGNNDKFGYEAIRIPWRQGMAALWYEDKDAIAQLQQINAFFETENPDQIRGGYDPKTGTPLETEYVEVAFVATAAMAAVISTKPGYQKHLLENTITLRSPDYSTNEGMRLNALLFLSGGMKH